MNSSFSAVYNTASKTLTIHLPVYVFAEPDAKVDASCIVRRLFGQDPSVAFSTYKDVFIKDRNTVKMTQLQAVSSKNAFGLEQNANVSYNIHWTINSLAGFTQRLDQAQALMDFLDINHQINVSFKFLSKPDYKNPIQLLEKTKANFRMISFSATTMRTKAGIGADLVCLIPPAASKFFNESTVFSADTLNQFRSSVVSSAKSANNHTTVINTSPINKGLSQTEKCATELLGLKGDDITYYYAHGCLIATLLDILGRQYLAANGERIPPNQWPYYAKAMFSLLETSVIKNESYRGLLDYTESTSTNERVYNTDLFDMIISPKILPGDSCTIRFSPQDYAYYSKELQIEKPMHFVEGYANDANSILILWDPLPERRRPSYAQFKVDDVITVNSYSVRSVRFVFKALPQGFTKTPLKIDETEASPFAGFYDFDNDSPAVSSFSDKVGRGVPEVAEVFLNSGLSLDRQSGIREIQGDRFMNFEDSLLHYLVRRVR